jgi:hypothetical protein
LIVRAVSRYAGEVIARRRLPLCALAVAVLAPVASANAAIWLLNGESRLTASLGGASRTQTADFRGTLVLADDGTYQVPGAGVSCAAGGTAAIEEVGTWAPGRRGRLRLEASNVDELRLAAGACLGFALRVRHHRRWVKVDATGQMLRGKATWAGTAAVNGHTVAFRLVTRYQGSPALAAPGTP